MSASRRILFGIDFDRTLARTFEESPTGMCAEKAHRLVLSEMFGPNGLAAYRFIGGLNGCSRSPAQLIAALLSHNSTLSTQSPASLTAEFVDRKLEILLAEITDTSNGPCWPAPYDGVKRFFETVAMINAAGAITITPFVISSGHRRFIRKTFQVAWRFPVIPEMVAEDDIRATFPEAGPEATKPGSLPFQMAVARWLGYEFRQAYLPRVSAPEFKSSILFIGDHPGSDGAFARNFGVPYLCFNPTNNAKVRSQVKSDEGHFTSWDWLSDLLIDRETQRQLKEGASTHDVFVPKVTAASEAC